MFIVLLWIVFSFVIWAGARSRGRFGFDWFLLSCCISPILAGIALLIVGPTREVRQR